MQQRNGRLHTPSVVVESYHSDRAGRRRSHTGDRVSHDDELQKMQSEIDYLRRRLKRRRSDRQSPSFSSSDSFEDGKGWDDHQISKSPPSESRFVSSSLGKYKKGRGQRAGGWLYQGTGNDAMSKALRQISKSPFARRINKAKLPHRFSQPTFTVYNGRNDPVEHVSNFNQKMVVHSNNEALMCKVFPSSLGPMAMHWFDALEEGSVGSFEELTRAFGARFITCSRVPKPLDTLLSMAMREGETLKTYSDRYWETYNEIDGGVEDVAISINELLNHLLSRLEGQFGHQEARGNTPRPALDTINVILVKPGGKLRTSSRVMSVRGGLGDEAVKRGNQITKRVKVSAIPVLGFSEEDKEGRCQPHDDALVVTIRIGGYDVKRVLVDDGSGAKIMYLDLFNGLNLKAEDLEKYDSPLVGFDGKPMIPQGRIKLLVQVEDEEVQVNFIVVKAYSPYTAILARPWLHAMGAVLSTLHVKVKYPTCGRVGVLLGSQSVARQCLVSAIIKTTENPKTGADQKTL
ncbi:uncharacterized protein LOC142635015 [Castanea sativa]|uniref:uncharacterized protein LOC142635015 n=1 Tax=Castanea sativa TaxID=21020 RepID=UPI003F6508B7